MNRQVAWLVAAIFLVAIPASAQTGGAAQQKGKKPGQSPNVGARLHFHAAQAALFSAMAHAEALVQMTDEPGELDVDIAHSHVHTVNRDTNSVNTESVKMGQEKPSLEKEKSLKALRSHLDEALKAADDAASAVDGHGSVAPAAKKARDHLKDALGSLLDLADDIDAKPLPAPGAKEIKEASNR